MQHQQVTKSETLTVPRAWVKWWTERKQIPLSVTVRDGRASVAGSVYHIYPNGRGGYICSRPATNMVVGVIYEYGVREALTLAFFQELSAIRAVVFGKSYPSVVAYEMFDHSLVHPGPCFSAHPCANIRKSLYKLTNTEEVCSVCKGRFL